MTPGYSLSQPFRVFSPADAPLGVPTLMCYQQIKDLDRNGTDPFWRVINPTVHSDTEVSPADDGCHHLHAY